MSDLALTSTEIPTETGWSISPRAYTLLAVSFIGAAVCSHYSSAAAIGVVLGTAISVHFLLGAPMVRWYGIVAIGNSLFWISYGLAIGSFPALSDMFGFISTEGRVLVATIPLIGLSGVRLDNTHLRILERVFEWVAVLLIVLLAAHLLRLPLPPRPRNGNFHGFTSSHHASGFVAGITLIVLLATRRDRTTVRWALIAGSVAAVVASNSRASMVGLVFAVLFLTFWRMEIGRLLKSVAALAVVVSCLMAFVPRVGTTVESLMDSDFQAQVSVVYQGGERQQTSTANANILRRFSNFSTARDAFVSSPLIGIGAWRYDDENLSRSGIEGISAPYVTGKRLHSDSHAHNVYFQFLAETGLIGAGLISILWLGLLATIRRTGRLSRAPDFRSPWLVASWCGVGFGFGVSLADIGLINPALSFPLLIVVGSVLACDAHAVQRTVR